MENILILLCIGLAAGCLSGLVGVGGGIIIVPALVYFLSFNQQMAQGTSLSILLLPTGIFAVMNYYQKGYVDWKVALIIASSFLLGGFIGSKVAISLDQNVVKKIFAAFMVLMGLKMLIWK
ncbi:MAG TPA: sulfite exporter TauE/SafE family protein [Bacteroidia bacterium]|nr:sulfite exporter TauE/SafE family protein [Bacteroidia bacterium]